MAMTSGSTPIFYPDQGSPLTPLANVFKSVVDSIVSLLRNNGFSTRVSSLAERDAMYPAPVQGDRVFRTDLGYEQVYFAAYSAGNPGGMPSAGWARSDARVRQTGEVSKATDANGDITITHGLPVAPKNIQITGIASGVLPNRLTYGYYSINDTTFTVRTWRQDTGGAFANNNSAFSWEASI